ncbi:MAG: TetR family transcriptional regulator [Stenotrophobium sp.]
MKNLIDSSTSKKAPEPATNGRQRLMEAALQLAATTRSLASLGLREVARQAGLNPNTFYRHFNNFDELGLAIIEQLSAELRKGLRERRLRAAASGLRLSDIKNPAESLQPAQGIVRESVGLVLDFVSEHRAAYVVGIRELHGTSPVLRKALRQVMDGIAADMAEDILGALRLPLLSTADVHEISRLVIRQMTFFSLDYVENPDQREDIRRQAERFILLLFWGAMAAKAPDALAAAKLRFPED